MLAEQLTLLKAKPIYALDMRISIVLLGSNVFQVYEFEELDNINLSILQNQQGAEPDYVGGMEAALSLGQRYAGQTSNLDIILLGVTQVVNNLQLDLQNTARRYDGLIPVADKVFQGFSYTSNPIIDVRQFGEALTELDQPFRGKALDTSNTYATISSEFKKGAVPETKVVKALNCMCPDGSFPDNQGKCANYDYTDEELDAKAQADKATANARDAQESG